LSIDEDYGGVGGGDSWGWETSECHCHTDHKPPEFVYFNKNSKYFPRREKGKEEWKPLLQERFGYLAIHR
jgi:hypothetical protein